MEPLVIKEEDPESGGNGGWGDGSGKSDGAQ